MKSKTMKLIILSSFMTFGMAISYSCQQGTSEQVEKTVDVSEAILPKKDTGKSFCSIDTMTFKPETTEGYIKQKDGHYVISVASYTLTKGFYFDLSVDSMEDLTMTHKLGGDINRVTFNYTDGIQLTTFYSNICSDVTGTIYIYKYDAEKKTISGSLKTKICSKEPAYDASTHHELTCQFSDVELVDL